MCQSVHTYKPLVVLVKCREFGNNSLFNRKRQKICLLFGIVSMLKILKGRRMHTEPQNGPWLPKSYTFCTLHDYCFNYDNNAIIQENHPWKVTRLGKFYFVVLLQLLKKHIFHIVHQFKCLLMASSAFVPIAPCLFLHWLPQAWM